MKAIGIQSTGVATLSYQFRNDHTLVGFGCTGGTSNQRFALSYDQNVTAAGLASPAANGVDRNLIATTILAAAPTFLATPVSAGEVVYVAFSAAGTAVLYLEDPA